MGTRRALREDPHLQLPESRVTDHRIKFTSHNLDNVLAGDLSAFTQALQDEDRSRSLEAASRA